MWTADEDQLFDDTLLKGVSLLQPFNIFNAGGIERVLQLASDLSQRRSRESITRQANPSLRDRFGVNMWKDFTSQRLPSNEYPTDAVNGTDSKNSDVSAASSNPSLVSQITNTVWKGITNQTAMEIPSTPTSPTVPIPPHNPEPEVNPQTTSKTWSSYAEKLKGSNTIATLSKMSSNWRARALLSSSGGISPPANIVSNEMFYHSRLGSNSYEQDSPRTSLSFSTHSPDLRGTGAEGSSLQSNKSLLEKTRSLISPRSPPPLSQKPTPKSAPKPLLLTSTLVNSGQSGLKSHRNLINSSTIRDPEEWADVMREKQRYIYRDSLSSTSSLSPPDRYVRTPKSIMSDRESDTGSSRIVSLNRRSVSPMAPSFRSGRGRLQSRASSASSGFTSPPTLPRSPLPENRKTSARIASTSKSPTILQTYSPPLDPNGSRTAAFGPKESDDSDATSNERRSSVIRLTEAEDAELSIQASRVRAKRYPRTPNLSIPDGHKPHSPVEEKGFNSSQLTVEWPQYEIEVDSTPRESGFDSEEHVPISRKLSRSPLRKKLSTGELGHQRKVSVDTIRDYRQRKVSNGHRPRKISTESREIPKSRRDSSAEEGDDEGYDELLSAYESEDGPRSSLEY